MTESDFDENDFNEEKLVSPTLIGIAENKPLISFNFQNINDRDARIKFFPKQHIYTIDNVPVQSASTVISKFFPEFDPFTAASNLKPSNPLYGLKVEDIVNIWDKKGKEAAKLGTLLHELIENFYLNKEYVRTKEVLLFENFILNNTSIRPFRTEWRIFDEQYGIAGTIDLISKKDNLYEMYDWKRSSKIVNPHIGEPITNNPWQRGIGKLSNIDDTSYNRYCLQQSLYKYILEKNYGIKISKMYLVVLHSDYNKYYQVDVQYFKDEIKYILGSL